MAKRIVLLVCLLGATLGAGCKDADLAEFKSLGRPHTVTVWSGGKAVRVYYSTGNVSFQDQGTLVYFEDRETHKLIEIAGTVTIEQD